MRSQLVLAFVIAVGWCVAPAVLFAQGRDPIGTIVPCNGIDCGLCDFATLVQNLLNGGIIIAGTLSAILFSYGGFLYLTSAGDAAKAGRGRQVLINVVVGLIIILAGWLIVDTVMKVMLKGDFGPWNKICDLPPLDSGGRR